MNVCAKVAPGAIFPELKFSVEVGAHASVPGLLVTVCGEAPALVHVTVCPELIMIVAGENRKS